MNPKPYEEIIDFLDITKIMIQGLDKPDTKEDNVKLNIGILTDLKSSIENLIKKLESK